MKTWVEAGSPDGILEVARDPVYRAWENTDGVVWLVAIEFSSLKKDSPLWLTFKNPFREVATNLPPGVWLGELSNDDLSRLLQEAG